MGASGYTHATMAAAETMRQWRLPPPPAPPRKGEGGDGTACEVLQSGSPPPCGEGLGVGAATTGGAP
jgi:hypothetical protein